MTREEVLQMGIYEDTFINEVFSYYIFYKFGFKHKSGEDFAFPAYLTSDEDSKRIFVLNRAREFNNLPRQHNFRKLLDCTIRIRPELPYEQILMWSLLQLKITSYDKLANYYNISKYTIITRRKRINNFLYNAGLISKDNKGRWVYE